MIICWIVGAYIASYSIAQIFESIFQCTPMEKAWNLEMPGTCLNPTVAATIPAALNVAADFMTVIMPMPLIWNMHMQRRWRIQLIGIFMLGGL